MTKIRILYINPTGDLYGASRVLLRLITTLNQELYEPIVVVPEKGALVDALQELGVSVKIIPFLSVIRRGVLGSWRIVLFLVSLLPSIIYIWWLIRRLHIDLVHTNSGVVVTPALATWLSQVPHIWHLHEVFSEEFPQWWKYYQRFILHFSNKVLCVSTPVAEQFCDQSNVAVLHNGIDLTEFSIQPEEIINWRNKYSSGDFTKLVGVVGRISPRKGQDVLIKAIARLRTEGYDIRLLVVGDTFSGNEFFLDELKALVESEGLENMVCFTGFLSNPIPLMAVLDVLVLPSILPEAFPTVVLEAMALGVPVIATNIGGTVEQIMDKETGILVSPGSTYEIENAIKLLLKDPILRQDLQKKAREQIETAFTMRAMCSQLETTYQQMIGSL